MGRNGEICRPTAVHLTFFLPTSILLLHIFPLFLGQCPTNHNSHTAPIGIGIGVIFEPWLRLSSCALHREPFTLGFHFLQQTANHSSARQRQSLLELCQHCEMLHDSCPLSMEGQRLHKLREPSRKFHMPPSASSTLESATSGTSTS